jgi:L-Lysine epsilon oxidase N-terminal/L-lysine epsilon oxidase C-terminal domain
MSYTSLRIHPAIGIARVGNSEEYYLGPESMAGMDQPGGGVTGGLPIKPGSERSTIMSTDLRDGSGRLKRQAARFRIFQYQFAEKDSAESYPTGGGIEVKIGSKVDGKTVKDIVWTVHLANKKANSWQGGEGIEPFQNNQLPPLRNPAFGHDAASPDRLRKLVIDAGPRALQASSTHTIHFDRTTTATWGNAATGTISTAPDYPVSFPASSQSGGGPLAPAQAITTLGSIHSEAPGRLIVVGGFGHACSFDAQGNFDPNGNLPGDVNNNNWLDDTADGPVTAFLLFEDATTMAVDGSAWVISTDPAYAPQTPNIVTLWDELFQTFVEHYNLQPSIYANSGYQNSYRVDFANQVYPIFRACSLQKWNTFLPQKAITVHDQVGQITADWSDFMIMNFIRNPDEKGADQIGAPLMPLSLGDAGKSFLSPTKTQYFLLKQWSEGNYLAPDESAPALGPGEALDRTILFNCLGGRFSPGIEMSFVVRDVNLYRKGWTVHANGGPFRLNRRELDYRSVKKDTPLLGVGYTPLRTFAVEPGDLCKFMALPWHTDYNSCATHLPSPNPGGNIDMKALKQDWNQGMPAFNTLLYSSWPAQRPVAVYTYDDVVANRGSLAKPRFSVRGEGTGIEKTVEQSQTGNPDDWKFTLGAASVGRYQDRKQFLLNWHKIGVVMQSPAIKQLSEMPVLNSDFYLEVESQFDTDHSNLAEYWRNTVIDKLYPPEK